MTLEKSTQTAIKCSFVHFTLKKLFLFRYSDDFHEK
jgi:hypothetical protein